MLSTALLRGLHEGAEYGSADRAEDHPWNRASKAKDRAAQRYAESRADSRADRRHRRVFFSGNHRLLLWSASRRYRGNSKGRDAPCTGKP